MSVPVLPPPASEPVNYQVLARKYRPSRFADLIGQEAMVRTLTNAFASGRIAHAYLLTGERGVGKTTTARLLARALNYKSASRDEPCIDLSEPGLHCPDIIAGRHPDVLELDAASRTGVSDMRDLLDGVRYSSTSARFRVYIIDEVHMLSLAAANAMLKTLEEPPAHVKFIFATTEPRKIPITVLSRCQRFNLRRLGVEELSDHLETVSAAEGERLGKAARDLIARAAEGSVRDAMSLLDQAIVLASGAEASETMVCDMLGIGDRERILDLLESAMSGNHRSALTHAEALVRDGSGGHATVRDLLELVSELGRIHALGNDWSYAGPTDWAERLRKLAARSTPGRTARLWRLLLTGHEDCLRAPDPDIAARMAVLRLSAAALLPTPEEAAEAVLGGRASTTQTNPPPRTHQHDPPAATRPASDDMRASATQTNPPQRTHQHDPPAATKPASDNMTDHPRIREALDAFPGAKVVGVTDGSP